MIEKASRNVLARYAFSAGVVVVAFVLKKLLEPVTGTGAPFVLFFAAVVAASLFAGPGPGVFATALSIPLGAITFVVRAGYPLSQAGSQAALFALDGLIVVYLSSLMARSRQTAESYGERLRLANEATAIVSWDLDVATGRLRWSPSTGVFPGFLEDGPAELGLWGSLVHPDDREVFRQAYERSLDPAGDGVVRCEIRLRRDDGLVRWVSWVGRTSYQGRDEGRTPVGQVGTAIDITERRQREETLKNLSAEVSRSEAHLRDLIELAPDAFFLADLEGRFIDVNQAACRMLGYERDELVGRTSLDIIPPEDAPRLAAVREALLVPGQVNRGEWTLVRKDGTPVPVEVSSNILPNGHWQAFVRDISQRRRIEDERQVFVSLLENSSDFIGIADATGKPVYVNPAGRRMVGMSADYPVEQTLIPDYYPPEERSFVEGEIVKSMVERGRWSGETHFRHWQTGEAIPVSHDHFTIRDPSGQRVIGMGTVTRDISEARRSTNQREELLARERLAREEAETANHRLRESEERFRLTIDEAPIGMALVALDGRFARVNGALCEIVGYRAEELEKLRFQEITHPDDLDSDVALLDRLFRGEIPRYQLEKRYIRKDGTIVDIMLSTSILRSREGAPLNYIAQIEDVTARKRLADDLRRAEARSSGILSISADGIISIDESQRITLFNEGAEAIFGYSRAEVMGAPLELLIPERFRAGHRGHVEAFAADQVGARRMGQRSTLIFGLRKNGEEFPADATISRLQIGETKLLTVALRDITEQKRAQDALRESRERFDLALQGADLASWDWNIKTGEVIFNARWAEMRGFRPDEIEPRVESWVSGLHDDDRSRVDKALKDFFRGSSPVYETEHRVRTKSGEWIWILDRGKVFARDELGQPTRMVGTELDITERKRAEDQKAFLAEAGTVLASTLDFEETLAAVARVVVHQLADCAIVDVAEEGTDLRRLLVVHADSSKAQLCDQLRQLGIDRPGSALAGPMAETQEPALISELGPEYLASIAQNEAHLRCLLELGPRSMMVVPLRGRGGLLGKLVLLSSAPKRRYGAADLALAKELAIRASLAVDNARLYETARRAIRVRDDVLGIVAHDLRNPLAAISMQAALLRRRGEEAAANRRTRTPAEAIDRAAARANRLIQDLLDVTRMEAGHLSVDQARIAPKQVAAESVAAQQTLANATSVALRLEVPDDLGEIWADRDRLLQVFENLIGNALKFTEPGGIVRLGAAPRDGEVLFWVADTGAGIAAEDIPHLFDRFWQAQKARRGGAGLGLPIVKGIIEAHGGRLWIETSLGEGSTFFFTIPTAQPEEASRSESPHAP